MEYKQSTFSTLAVKIITHFNSCICSDNIFFQNKFYWRYSLKIGHCKFKHFIQKKKLNYIRIVKLMLQWKFSFPTCSYPNKLIWT